MPRRPWYLTLGKRLLKPCLIVTIILFVTGSFLVVQIDDGSTKLEENFMIKEEKSKDAVPRVMKPHVGQPPPLVAEAAANFADQKKETLDHLLMKQMDNDPMGNPIVLWWTPFTGEIGTNRQCGAGTCFFTQVRLSLHLTSD